MSDRSPLSCDTFGAMWGGAMSLQEIFQGVQGWLAELWHYPIPWGALFLWAAIIVGAVGAVIAVAVVTTIFSGRGDLAMVKKTNFDVVFVATYDDGRSESFNIDKFTLRSGDHVARLIAGEWQPGGRLPAGKIVSVKRLVEG
jgi:hypothetical protein